MTDPNADARPPSFLPEDGPDTRSDFVEATERPYDPRLTVAPGRFLGGALATAIVAALAGLVGVIVLEDVVGLDLVPPPDAFATGSHGAAFAVAGALLAFLAAGVLVLLIVSTPRPRLFFGWLMALTTVVVTVLPFSWTDDVGAAIASAAVNLLIGSAVWSLLTGVAGRTIEVRPAEPGVR
ncbi:DUF6069 family protein [Sediminihabitans luteus]|nr:DUF6069 family protein [Sediminihabitans luteus]